MARKAYDWLLKRTRLHLLISMKVIVDNLGKKYFYVLQSSLPGTPMWSSRNSGENQFDSVKAALRFHLKMPYLCKFEHWTHSPDSALNDSASSSGHINPWSLKVFDFFFLMGMCSKQLAPRLESSSSIRDAEMCISLLTVTPFEDVWDREVVKGQLHNRDVSSPSRDTVMVPAGGRPRWGGHTPGGWASEHGPASGGAGELPESRRGGSEELQRSVRGLGARPIWCGKLPGVGPCPGEVTETASRGGHTCHSGAVWVVDGGAGVDCYAQPHCKTLRASGPQVGSLPMTMVRMPGGQDRRVQLPKAGGQR